MFRRIEVAEGPARWLVAGTLGLVLAPLAGCGMGPFKYKDRTTMVTPAMRMAAIRETGARVGDAEASEQQKTCEQLAQQIQTEPDPLVRRTIQETVAKLNAPLARDMLVAGLQDEDREVRMQCCRLLGRRGDAAAIERLAVVAQADADFDVRMAAVDALGNIKTPASVAALAAALKDSDPAMQYAGVQAMRGASGQDLGNDVNAWRQYAESLPAGAGSGEAAVASNPDAPLPR
ncbi:MAG: HEAT repeat domain-containing protein [Pirellulales bacterium]|nr:HEAT repeat domain-containing protein [Pirellulales bacterium]